MMAAVVWLAWGAAELLEEPGRVEVVAEGYEFTEGPVWVPGTGLLFSDIPADTIYRYDGDTAVFRRPSGKSNGLALDTSGRLLACEHGNRRLSRTEADGSVTTVAERYDGKRLNSPNDAVVRSDGTIFFTDPPYGLEGREAELPFSGVYAVSPEGQLKLLVEDFLKPNGIGLSPDEETLYVADTEGNHIRAFDVREDGTVAGGRIFGELPWPDGLAVDEKGRVWCTAADGIHVFEADGTLRTTVAFPQAPANCAFGGEDGRTLYVTARTAVYRIRTRDAGLMPRTAPVSNE